MDMRAWPWWTGVVLAAQAGSAMASPAPVKEIVIPPRPLEAALMELTRQSGSNILFLPGSMAGLTSRPVRARGLDQALKQMLAGTSIRVLHQAHGVVIAPGRLAAKPAAPHAGSLRPQPAHPALPPMVIVVSGRETATSFGAEPFHNVSPDVAILSPAERPTARNLAEAFARSPGVLVLATNLQGDLGGIDRAGRAEGQFLAIRGLSGAFAAVRVDGVDLPQSLPFGRDAELGMLSTLVFDKARITLTPGAQEAGDATSALVDLATPSAFADRHPGLRITLGGDLDGQAMAYRQPAASWQAGLRYTHRFGEAQQWGLALGVTASRRIFATSEQTYQQGTVELKQVTAAGTTPVGIDPAANLLLTGLNLEFTRGSTFSLAGHGALEWHGDRLQAALRVLHAVSRTRQDIYQLGLQGGNSAEDETLTNLGGGISQIASTTARAHYWYETNPENSRLTMVQARIGSAEGLKAPFDWQARLGFTQGVTARPDHIETSFWGENATLLSQGTAFTDGGGYPQPMLNAADKALIGNALSYPVHLQAERRDEEGRDRHWSFDGRLGWKPEQGLLSRLETGLRLDLARRSWRQIDVTYSNLFPGGTTLAQSGLVDGSIAAILPGVYDIGLPLVSGTRLAALITRATPDALTLDAANAQTLDGRETKASAFLRSVLGRGAITLQPGLRVESSVMETTFWLAGNQGVPTGSIAYGWNHGHARFLALLPSLYLDWRDGGWQARAGLWTSTTRPAVSQLSGAASLTTQADGSLLLTQGNPDLKAMHATNLDLSGAWHGAGGARLHGALFAKWLTHYIYDAGSDYANAATVSENGLLISQPVNGGTARVLGAELSASLPLGLVSQSLQGWTLGTAATALDGRVRLNNPLLDPVEHLQDAPPYNISVELGWARGAWSARIAGRWTGAFLQQYGVFGTSVSGHSRLDGSAFDIWVRPSRQIDLDIGHKLGERGEIRLFIRNLLADFAWRSTMGRASYAVPQTISGGRQFGVRADYAF